jgi:hypothetical protein
MSCHRGQKFERYEHQSSRQRPADNIDQETAFDKSLAELRLPVTRNFAVVFDVTQASSVPSISPNDISDYLHGQQINDSKQPYLWLNLWGWHTEHQQIIKIITKHYEVSP